jgi:WhiB family redox-sensing transcriptional regulator
MSTEWMGKGNCNQSSPAIFFPNDGIGVAAAQRICASCPVRVACLEYALTNHFVHGVWGGASERQRLRMQRDRRTAGAH